MAAEPDHYAVLGLPSGEEGGRLSEKEIDKAYKSKAMELHPDKRRDDPNAKDMFQKLRFSYDVLKNTESRKLFDDLLRVKRVKVQRQEEPDLKRRKMMSDLEKREQAVNSQMKVNKEEEEIHRKLRQEIAMIRKMQQANKTRGATEPFKQDTSNGGLDGMDGGGIGLDKEKVLKVSWEKVGKDYTAQELGEIFKEFGIVEDVVIKSSKNKRSALVVMASKGAAVAAIGNVLGDLSNPLLVLPIQAGVFSSEKNKEFQEEKGNVGARYQAFEDSVLEKMKKAAEKQKKAAEKQKKAAEKQS